MDVEHVGREVAVGSSHEHKGRAAPPHPPKTLAKINLAKADAGLLLGVVFVVIGF